MWLAPLTSPAAWTAQAQTNCSAASVFAALLTAIVTKGIATAQQKAKQTKDIVQGPYDFIVIGGGSSGSVVASRLSEVSSWKVLLLESGAEEPDLGMVPALYNRYLTGPFYDWQYTSQKSAWDAGRSIYRGKVMGGCSAVNALHYTRGNAGDYDHWRSLGNTGWSYKEVLPYFKKSENNLDPAIAADTIHHGKGGLQDVMLDSYLAPNTQLLMQAYEEAGIPSVQDVNGAKQIGVSRAPSSSNGERVSTNRAFLTPAVRKRPNLTVQTGATVRRVILSSGPGKPRAVAVEYDGPQGRKTVKLNKAAVLSAGSFNSPQVLMLSGIGPKQHLSDVGIKPIVDLPGVGQRLHDHMYAKGNVKFQLSKTATLGTQQQLISTVSQYVKQRMGPLTATGNPANVFFRSKYQKAGDPRPDIQIPIGGSQYLTSKGKNCATPETAGTYFNQLGFNAINLHPKSRGQILLNKTDPYGMPLIYYNIFGDESDLKPIYEAFRLAVKLNSTKVFRDNGITMSHNVPSQCAKLTFNTDEFWKCTFNGVGSANGHPTSTCSMGPDSDKLAVVTPRLEVRGVYGLRVIDASVMPGTPSGNTNAVCVMIGEVGSDFIKQDYKTSESVA
ncbi:glucose dehydrogenase [FAD, quinone]-like isoform X2 [Frankliniella occidentalis]|nr:glucose dehydrogenase [FAD, quinone]-like isoform X2 [Frankliniella occidentalis]XP_052131106.1 glucose dehydrogenase [FAD, quinone]-like isoform X2 [Frankliniella occidentalis]